MHGATSMNGPFRSIGSAFLEKRNNFHLIRLLAALAVIYGHAYAVTAAPNALFNTFASSAIVLVLAAMSWHFVEKPALSLKLRK